MVGGSVPHELSSENKILQQKDKKVSITTVMLGDKLLNSTLYIFKALSIVDKHSMYVPKDNLFTVYSTVTSSARFARMVFCVCHHSDPGLEFTLLVPRHAKSAPYLSPSNVCRVRGVECRPDGTSCRFQDQTNSCVKNLILINAPSSNNDDESRHRYFFYEW